MAPYSTVQHVPLGCGLYPPPDERLDRAGQLGSPGQVGDVASGAAGALGTVGLIGLAVFGGYMLYTTYEPRRRS